MAASLLLNLVSTLRRSDEGAERALSVLSGGHGADLLALPVAVPATARDGEQERALRAEAPDQDHELPPAHAGEVVAEPDAVLPAKVRLDQ